MLLVLFIFFKFFLPFCSDGCHNGFWGDLCDEICPTGCIGVRCHSKDGHCLGRLTIMLPVHREIEIDR